VHIFSFIDNVIDCGYIQFTDNVIDCAYFQYTETM